MSIVNQDKKYKYNPANFAKLAFGSYDEWYENESVRKVCEVAADMMNEMFTKEEVKEILIQYTRSNLANTSRPVGWFMENINKAPKK